MKRLLILAAAALIACGPRPTNNGNDAAEAGASRDGVEVLAFHAKKRCPTCIAVERIARETVEKAFAAEAAEGSLRFRTAGISDNEALADRYRVAWSALLIIRHRGDSEEVVDLTQSAFARARTHPEQLRSELTDTIARLLDKP